MSATSTAEALAASAVQRVDPDASVSAQDSLAEFTPKPVLSPSACLSSSSGRLPHVALGVKGLRVGVAGGEGPADRLGRRLATVSDG